MRKIVTRLAAGLLLILLALMPLAPAVGQPPQLPQTCAGLVFSTEEDFVTNGPEPPDGNSVISDGDLLGLEFSAAGVNCAICARNADLLQTFDVGVDLGLDAVDLVDLEAYLVAFSTEMNSSNEGQFTHGDLLVTGGAIIPNQALTYAFGQGSIGYDLGLDAIQFMGELDHILGFLDAAKQYSRGDWLQNPWRLAAMLEEAGIDLWYSTEGAWTPASVAGFLDGDLLSARDGVIVASNSALLPASVPAGIPARGVDFGLDAVASSRSFDDQSTHFSTEILYEGELDFTDGDVLKSGDGAAHLNAELVQCFEPKADFLGLDALHLGAQQPFKWIYLPLILKSASVEQ
ncbi:MAG: hypothetical protein JXA78_16535 [Anaerolineales bacterium]|nr:hypothetical protein [Anaerolineales bacterium]